MQTVADSNPVLSTHPKLHTLQTHCSTVSSSQCLLLILMTEVPQAQTGLNELLALISTFHLTDRNQS